MTNKEQQQHHLGSVGNKQHANRYNAELYERIRVLGKGSFGTAIVHRRQADGALVVLKEIDLRKLKQDADKLAMVIQEARIMSKLSHPNIIQYYNAYTRDNSKLVIEMEYARIGTLQTYLSLQTRPLDELEVLAIFRQILAGLEYLHSKSIVHLDLKMANIFVTSEGSVKIGDFGIARLMSRPQDDQQQQQQQAQSGGSRVTDQTARPRLASVGARTASGAPAAAAADETQHYCQLGTLAYSSPERCMGGPTGFKSDIWSLGCLLYELVELKPLFPAKSLAELVMSITEVRFEPMRRADVQSGLRNLFLLMISRQPNDRPAASELVYITDNLLHKHQQRRQTTTTLKPHHMRAELDARIKQPPAQAPPMQPPPPPPQTLSYPHSLVYQVRLSSRDVQVDRVQLPQSKRIKEIVKGRSHYLVLTYDNIVYGWGTRHRGQLGAAGSPTDNLMCASGRPSARRSPGTRHTRSARNSLTARDLQVFARSGDLLATTGTPTTSTRSGGGGGGGGQLSLTQPSSLASSTQTLIVGTGRQPSTPPLLLAGGPRPLADVAPTTRPFILSELNKRKIVRVAAGNDFSVFLSKTGIVMTCGDGSRGCLGRGELASAQTPCMVDALLSMDVVGVACGPEHVIAVCGNGQAFAWGNSRHGRLGLAPKRLVTNATNAEQSSSQHLRRNHLVVVPQLVEFPLPNVLIKSAFCGDKCTVFLDSQNNCWACGENTNNRLGLDVRRRFKRTLLVERSWQPAQILSFASNNKYTIVSCQLAANHATYLTSEGKLLVLGQDIDRSYKLRSDLISHSLKLKTTRQRKLSSNGELYLTNLGLPEVREPLGKIISRLLASDLLSNFKSAEHAPKKVPANRKKDDPHKLTRQQRRAIELYLKRARSCKKMPFDRALSASCTQKFTLALTNDNRVYFWGARTHDNEGDEQNRNLASAASFRMSSARTCYQKHQSIEPQLALNSSDECFIKIGATNNSLMSSIQLIGSDQPILHARNPQLRTGSLNDLWILDYKPGGACSLDSSCSYSSSPVSSRSSSSSSLSCQSCCYCDSCHLDYSPAISCDSISSKRSSCSSSNTSCHCCQSHATTKSAPKRHDSILEPQPIVSLYVPPMFGYNSCLIQLVNLFCFDEDRFFLVLDTTVKLASPSPLSRPTSRRGSLSLKQLSLPIAASAAAAVASHGQICHQNLTGFAGGAQQVTATPVKTLTTPRLNIVEESTRSSGDSQRQQPLVATTTTTTPELNDNNQQRERNEKIHSETLDCCRGVAADAEREQRRDQSNLFDAPEANLKVELSNGAMSVTPPSVSAHTGLSLEEPRSMSTFAPTFTGRHLIVGSPSLGDLNHDQADDDQEDEEGEGRPMMRKLSFDRSSHSHSFGPSYLLRRGRQRGAKSASGQRRRRARKGRALDPPESTAVTMDADDTSSMPTWVRNEYLQQLSSGPSSPDNGKHQESRSVSCDQSQASTSLESNDEEQQNNEDEEKEEETCVGDNELEVASVISAELTLTCQVSDAAIREREIIRHLTAQVVESREPSASSHSELSISTAIGVEQRVVATDVGETGLRLQLDDDASSHCSSASSQVVESVVHRDGPVPCDGEDDNERPTSRNNGTSANSALNNHASHLHRSQSNISTANKWFRLYLAEDLAPNGEEQWRIAQNLLECRVYKTVIQPAGAPAEDECASLSSSETSLGQVEAGELHNQHNAHDKMRAGVDRDPSPVEERDKKGEGEASRNEMTRQTGARRVHLLQQRALSQSTSCLPIERYTRISGDLTGETISHAANNYPPPVGTQARQKLGAKTGSRSSLSSIRKSLVRIFC